ncbi:MAG: LexA family protein [Candidatus Promineifilaceae bacterium]
MRETLEFIRQFKQQHCGISPTLREIADHLNTSSSIINYRLRVFEQKGFVRLIRNDHGDAISRGIQLVGEFYTAPIYGN